MANNNCLPGQRLAGHPGLRSSPQHIVLRFTRETVNQPECLSFHFDIQEERQVR